MMPELVANNQQDTQALQAAFVEARIESNIYNQPMNERTPESAFAMGWRYALAWERNRVK